MMINKIVKLDKIGYYRILDSIMFNDKTRYLVMNMEHGTITTIAPTDIFDIVEFDYDKGEFISISDIIIKNGM
jgi:hypothetical protein